MKKVSIIITTKNEEKNIENCLKSIQNQTYSNIETIVVDNNSNDKTKEISLHYTKLVFDKWPERSAQRNYGMIEIASGDYVMFVDADMILTQHLIKKCVEYCENNDCIALHISEVVLWSNYWSKVRRFERSFYDGSSIDWARFFRKKEFVQVWGFDESMSWPEDWDIDKKIKQIWKIWLLPTWENQKSYSMWDFVLERWVDFKKYWTVIYHNEAEFDLKKYLTKKWYYAQSFDTYIKKRWKDDQDIKKQLGFYYRFFGVFIENGKWKKLMSKPCLTFGMYFLRFMVWLKFIFRKKAA